jgi:hypothetical protein
MKRVLLAGLAVLALGFAFVAVDPSTVAAAPKDDICKGVSITGGNCGDSGGIEVVIRNIINIFSILVGVVAVFMVMYAGFKYVTSGGDSGKVKSAKDTLIYAIVGIVIVAFSQLIVQFVLKAATEPVTQEPITADEVKE